MSRYGETRASAMQNLLIALDDISSKIQEREMLAAEGGAKAPRKLDAAEALLNCIRKVIQRQSRMKLSEKLQQFILDFCEYKPKTLIEANIKTEEQIESNAKKFLHYWEAYKNDRAVKTEQVSVSPLAGKKIVQAPSVHSEHGWSKTENAHGHKNLRGFHVKEAKTPIDIAKDDIDQEQENGASHGRNKSSHTDFRVKRIFNRTAQMPFEPKNVEDEDESRRRERSKEGSSRKSRSAAKMAEWERLGRSPKKDEDEDPQERAASVFRSMDKACGYMSGPPSWKAKEEVKFHKRQLTFVPEQVYRPVRESLEDDFVVDDDPTGIKAKVRQAAAESLQAAYDSMSSRIKKCLAEIPVTEEMVREAELQETSKADVKSDADPNEKILKELKTFFRDRFNDLGDLVLYFDVNSNGHISYVEFKDGLRSLGFTWSNDKVRSLMQSISGEQGAGYLVVEELAWVFQDSKQVEFNDLGRAKIYAHRLHSQYMKWKEKKMKRGEEEEKGLPRPEKGNRFGINGRETEEMTISPEYSYFHSCNELSSIPLTLRWVWGGEKSSVSAVELPNSELLDDDLRAVMAPMLNCAKKEKLRMLDLANNAFSDQGLNSLFDMMNGEPRMYEALMHLDLSHNRLGITAINKLASMVGSKLGGLRKFYITGVVVPELCWSTLCQGLAQSSSLQELGFGDTCLGKVSQDSAIAMADLLKSVGTHLEILDISQNYLQHRGFAALGGALAEAPALVSLDLSSSAGGFQRKASVQLSPLATGGDNWYSPIPIICEALRDCTLKKLYMASCQLDFEADFVLEESLKGHPTMQYMDLRDNPHGMEGLRCLCRLLVSPECKIETCLMDNFRSCYVPPTAAIPSPTDPTGHYKLELSIPQHRSVLRVLKNHSFRSTNDPWKSMALDGKVIKEPPLQQRGDTWDVTSKGALDFTYSPNVGTTANSGSEACKLYHKARRMPVSLMRFVQLALLFRSLQSLEQIQTFATAVSKDLSLKISHLKFFINHIPDYLKWGSKIVPYVCRILFPALEDLDRFAIIDLCNSEMTENDASMSQTVTSELVYFNADCPTNHYELNLANPAERTIVEKLYAINYWHKKQVLTLNLPDQSKHGNYENIRNAVYCKLDFVWSQDWNIPFDGEFSFDYTEPIRPGRSQKPQDPDTVERLVETIMSSNNCRAQAKLRAIRSVAHTLKLSPQMVVQLLKIFRGKVKFQSSRMHGSMLARTSMAANSELDDMSFIDAPPGTVGIDDFASGAKGKKATFVPRCSFDQNILFDDEVNGRTDMFICLFNRCTDQPRLISKEVLYNRDLMDDSDMKDIKRRLGRILTFDAMHCCQENTNLGSGYPDGNRYECYLPLWEDHVIAKFLVTIAAIEPDDYGNIRYSRWSELTYQSAGEDYIIPATWLPDPPRVGTLKLTYVAEKMEYILPKQRFQLAEKLFAWQNGQPYLHEGTKPSRLASIYARV